MKPKEPWWKQSRQRSTQTKAVESGFADEIGGRRFVKSGAVSCSKDNAIISRAAIVRLSTGERVTKGASPVTEDGDLANARWHVEHKRTEAQSIGVRRDVLRKLRRGARRAGKDPALVIAFETEEWVCMPKDVFLRLVEAADE